MRPTWRFPFCHGTPKSCHGPWAFSVPTKLLLRSFTDTICYCFQRCEPCRSRFIRRFFGHHASHAPIFAMSFDSRWLAAAGHGRSEHDIHVSCEEFHFCRCMVCHRDFCSIAVPTLSIVLALFLEALLAAIGMPAIFNLDLGPLF